MVNFSLKLATAPLMEPVTVEDVRLHTRIDYITEDSMLATWISTAREMAETFTRRSLIYQTWELSFDKFPTDTFLYLPRPPLVQVFKMSYIDSESTETTMYQSHEYDLATESPSITDDDTTGVDDWIIDTRSEPGRIGLAYDESWPAVTLRPIDALRIRYRAGYGETAETVPACFKDAIMLYCAHRYENRTAESGSVPAQFYDLMRSERIFDPAWY